MVLTDIVKHQQGPDVCVYFRVKQQKYRHFDSVRALVCLKKSDEKKHSFNKKIVQHLFCLRKDVNWQRAADGS